MEVHYCVGNHSMLTEGGMERRLQKAPASEGGRYKSAEVTGCAKILGLCKQELLDCRRLEKPRSSAFSRKHILTPRVGRRPMLAWPRCRSRACWSWRSCITPRKLPTPRCNTLICRACRRNGCA